MAGFEVIVRPVVFPNIRPAPTRSLPPADDPEQGLAVLSGSSGQLIALSHSFTSNGSRPAERETKRRYDLVRISPSSSGGGSSRRSTREDDAADDDVYIDVEVVNQLQMLDDNGSGMSVYNYTPIQTSGNVAVIRRNVTRTTS